MSGTANLAVPYITAAQNQKEVTANAAFNAFDAALTERLAVSVASGNAEPTAAQYRAAAYIAVSGASASGRTVRLPAIKRPIFIGLDAASTKSVSVVRGTTSVTLLPGCTLYLFTDGTANGMVRLGEFGPYRAAQWVRGTPSAGEVLIRWRVQEASTLLPDLLGWDVRADVAATASSVLSVRRNGSGVGTITFAASGTVATLATTSSAAQAFAAGDYIDVVAPSPADATLANITLSMLIVRN